MIEIRQTPVYEKWFASLKDRATRLRIDLRIRRVSLGNFGNTESVGEGVSELKMDFGPGYRVYFFQHGNHYVLLLAGGDKSTQARDIKKAQELARNYVE